MTPTFCPACGLPRVGARELHRLAADAKKALEGMRLAVPDALAKNVRELARSLACHAGACPAQQLGLGLKAAR